MKPIKRRVFLKNAVAASAVGITPFNILKAGPSPNSKLNIACMNREWIRYSHSQGSRLIPESFMKEAPRPPRRAFRPKGGTHFDNWTLACKGEDTATSPFEYAGPLSEIIVLGDIALLHPGRKLLWDSENMEITNDEAANKSLFTRRLAPRDRINWL